MITDREKLKGKIQKWGNRNFGRNTEKTTEYGFTNHEAGLLADFIDSNYVEKEKVIRLVDAKCWNCSYIGFAVIARNQCLDKHKDYECPGCKLNTLKIK